MRVALTDRFVATAKAPDGERVEFFDAVAKGLSLRVSAGAKSWAFHYTQNNRRVRLTIGTYPALSLSQARAAAVQAKGDLHQGGDPRAQREQAATVADLISRYLAKHVRRNMRSAPALERRFARNVVPVIGHVQLGDLHRRDVNRVVDAIMAREKPTEATRVFEDIRAALRWAVRRGDLDRNPIEGMPKPASSQIRERVLSDNEIRALWTGLALSLAKSKQCQRIIKLCLVTAQRVGEVAGMRRDELDLDGALWSLPGSRTKNGSPHTVPLSPLAIEIMNGALADAGSGQFLFPAERGSLPAAAVARSISRANKDGRFLIAQWSAHDLRRTALTGMAKLGVLPIVLGHVANHLSTTKAGVTLAVYSKHTYDAEKRAALNLWATRLREIVQNADV